jgi:hypothetical protein
MAKGQQQSLYSESNHSCQILCHGLISFTSHQPDMMNLIATGLPIHRFSDCQFTSFSALAFLWYKPVAPVSPLAGNHNSHFNELNGLNPVPRGPLAG